MVYLSVISFIASFLYFQFGYKAIRSNSRSKLCRICFLMTLSMTIWAFGEGFLYLSNNSYTYSFWNKIAAFGWCSFEAIVLLFVLILIENKMIEYWYVKLLILSPAIIFLLMALFLFGPDIKTAPIIQNIFYIGDFLYNFTYLAVSILLILLWGKKSKSKIRKRQAKLIVITSMIPFLLNLVEQIILPYFHVISLPNMGQIFTLIMLFGIDNAITKYQFLSIPSVQLSEEFFHEFTGYIFLTDSQGRIMKANNQANQLLSNKNNDIIGKNIVEIFEYKEVRKVLSDCESIRKHIRYTDINLSLKSGISIPLNLTIIPLLTKSKLVKGVLVIGEDIRATKCLQEEIEKHKLTNEKLINSEMLLRNMLEIIPVSIFIISRKTGRIVYLNKQAISLMDTSEASLKGKEITPFIKYPEDKQFLMNCFYIHTIMKKDNIQLKKMDGSEFVGLVTVIPTIYNEEEVAVACVVDMTEQKNTEEILKQNNEDILKLNEELININNILTNKSIRDGLTSLYNHQYMNEIMEIKLKETGITKSNLCLMMMDVDHFKEVNDKYGHLVGDKVLKEIADLILKNTRENDYIGRYGGEEFITMLPDTDMDNALKIAEDIRRDIQNHNYDMDNLKVTISIGVAHYTGQSLNSLINSADVLLYQAKSNGRNRVEY